MVLAGVGTGNPITDENYTDNKTVSFRGHALAILRSGYEKGNGVLTVSGDGVEGHEVFIEVVEL